MSTQSTNQDKQTSTASEIISGVSLSPSGRLETGFNHFSEVLLKFSAILIGLLTLPICADIFARTVLDKTIDGMMEIEVMTLVVIAFASMPYTFVSQQPIRIDMFYQKFSYASQKRLDYFASLLGFCICSVLAWETLWQTLNWTSLTMVLRIPESIFMAWTCIGFTGIAVACFFQLIHSAKALLANKDRAGLAFASLALFMLSALPFLYRMADYKLTGLVIGCIAFCILMLLLFLRIPIGLAMACIGLLGLIAIYRKFPTAFDTVGPIPFRYVSDFVFVALPMFMLMGELTFYSGLSGDLFSCANRWLGRIPGGLAIASIAGCAGFGAVCGDSFSCVVTMSSVALPPMRAKGYDNALACGSLAAGGTLGILIPPSMGFIFYSIITEESVGQLFIAGIVPGILLTIIFGLIVYVQVKRCPSKAPLSEKYSMKEKLLSTVYLLPVLALFLLVVGGIMMGWFTPGEGGAVGAMGAFVYALARRRLTLENLNKALRHTALMSGKIFLIFSGVYIFGAFLSQSRLPIHLANTILELNVNRYAVLAIVCVLYIILGCVMNILPMMLLTLPSIYPTITGLGFDGIWFGVVTVILMEMGMITPPVGMNVFTLSSLVPDIPMASIYRGVIPFFLGMIGLIIILAIFPALATWLPSILM